MRILFFILFFSFYSFPSFSQEKQLNCLAKAVYFEARGTSEKNMKAVAEVVVNRTKSGKFPSTACGVVYQKNQFEWTNKKQVIKDKNSWNKSISIADEIYNSSQNNITKGALYFHNKYVKPKWSRKMLKTAIINAHIYYKESA